jgi:hypothetical protein
VVFRQIKAGIITARRAVSAGNLCPLPRSVIIVRPLMLPIPLNSDAIMLAFHAGQANRVTSIYVCMIQSENHCHTDFLLESVSDSAFFLPIGCKLVTGRVTGRVL